MGLQRLRPGEIHVGSPLPWNAYDAAGRLLLRRGAIIHSDDQLQRLLEVGLFSEGGTTPDPHGQSSGAELIGTSTPHVVRDRVSVFEVLDDVRARLASLMFPQPTPEEFPARLLELAGAVQRACEIDSDAALASVLLSRWMPYSVRQSCNCAVICEVLFRQLEWPPEKRLPGVAAALTMNLPILELQDSLYHQKEPLDEAQKAAIFAHPGAAAAALAALGVDDPVWLATAAQHHEALDGSGYPAHLQGDAISIEARVLAIVDKYCAMISERAHRDGLPADAALRQMLVSNGKGLDTGLAARLIRELGIYPPGTAVELINREIGVVVKRTLDARHPVVRIVVSAQGRPLPEFPKRLTSKPAFEVNAAVSRTRLGPTFDPMPLWNPSLVNREP